MTQFGNETILFLGGINSNVHSLLFASFSCKFEEIFAEGLFCENFDNVYFIKYPQGWKQSSTIAKCASDVMPHTNKPELRTISLKHLKQPVFLKHPFEARTSLRSPLFLSEHADVV